MRHRIVLLSTMVLARGMGVALAVTLAGDGEPDRRVGTAEKDGLNGR